MTVSLKLLVTAKLLTNNDISFFLKSGAALDIKLERPKPVKSMSDKLWLNIIALSKKSFADGHSPFFSDIADNFSKNEEWTKFIDSNEPEMEKIPEYQEKIDGQRDIGKFIHACLVRSLREDRTLVISTEFIKTTLGPEFIMPITDTPEDLFNETSARVPVI